MPGHAQDTDTPRPRLWHTLDAKATTELLNSDVERGLDAAEVARRMARTGRNEIQEAKARSVWSILIAQFSDFMIVVLLMAALVSGVVGDLKDAVAILVIVLLNAVIGTVQEYRAERAISALRRLAAPEVRVRRNGAIRTVPSGTLVPGDVVLLEAGNLVAADVRLIHTAGFQVDEAPLTGESHAVEKVAARQDDPDLPLGDRHNMAYKGTVVTRGRAVAIVVATGMSTELGRIASLLREAETVRTPLQRRLARFGRHLAWVILAIASIVFAFGVLRGEPVVLMFLTGVSLAVAAIPEALPAVVAIALAFGAAKMSRRHALIRHLPAVETLGSVTYICTDKTGTLTQNRMRMELLFADGRRHTALPARDSGHPLWERFGEALALSNDVVPDGHGTATGDPTEVALYRAAAEAGYQKSILERRLPRIGEHPFDAERRIMSTLHRVDHHIVVFTKGAPEQVLNRCTTVLTSSGPKPLRRDLWLPQADSLAAEGHRVLAIACREISTTPEALSGERVEQDLCLLGLVALIDPPRPEVPGAVAACRSAGITPVMITGDHPGTARAIARRLNILGEDGEVLTGRDLDGMSLAEFERHVEEVRVYARVDPEQKIKIVRALQDKGEFIAMTGDGVNDAPALKQADIGVAMGRKGTDVAREAADMVLLDDNFATIVTAVREGRRIYDNIRKFVRYTMTSNSGEIWTLFLAPFLGLPIPLLPIQILWINLVTDGLPGLALAAEPEERGVMRRPPRDPRESIFAHGMSHHILWIGLLIGGLSLGSQACSYHGGSDHWQTICFTVLTLCQLAHAIAIRAERDSIFTIGLFSNPPLLGAVLLTVVLQLGVIYLPSMNSIFHTEPLTPKELGWCLTVPLVVFLAVELEKLLVRRGILYGSPGTTRMHT